MKLTFWQVTGRNLCRTTRYPQRFGDSSIIAGCEQPYLQAMRGNRRIEHFSQGALRATRMAEGGRLNAAK